MICIYPVLALMFIVVLIVITVLILMSVARNPTVIVSDGNSGQAARPSFGPKPETRNPKPPKPPKPLNPVEHQQQYQRTYCQL